jgi:hypothetical protein
VFWRSLGNGFGSSVFPVKNNSYKKIGRAPPKEPEPERSHTNRPLVCDKHIVATDSKMN